MFVVGILGFIVWLSIVGVSAMMFNKNCGDYLLLASNSGSLHHAKGNLKKAIDYIEKEELTEGFTSVIYETPDEDVGYWYQNLKVAYQDLEKVDSASSLEQTNMLMKFRETILGKEDQIVYPDGISYYPHNTILFILVWGSVLLFLFAGGFELMSEL